MQLALSPFQTYMSTMTLRDHYGLVDWLVLVQVPNTSIEYCKVHKIPSKVCLKNLLGANFFSNYPLLGGGVIFMKMVFCQHMLTDEDQL